MVTISPLPKAAAHSCQPDMDFFSWQSQACTQGLHNELRCLGGSIYFSSFRCNMGKAVAWFHRIVRQEWSCISSLYHFSCLFKSALWITIFAEHCTWLFCHFSH